MQTGQSEEEERGRGGRNQTRNSTLKFKSASKKSRKRKAALEGINLSDTGHFPPCPSWPPTAAGRIQVSAVWGWLSANGVSLEETLLKPSYALGLILNVSLCSRSDVRIDWSRGPFLCNCQSWFANYTLVNVWLLLSVLYRQRRRLTRFRCVHMLTCLCLY